MRRALALLFLGILLAPLGPRAQAEDNTLTPEELNQGWILLFDGETLFGWETATEANWHVQDGAITVSEGERGLLNTTSQFGDYELKLQFRSPVSTNSGIFLRTPTVPQNPAEDCYELNIAGDGVSPFSTGSFVNRQKAAAGLHTGEWQSYHVRAKGGNLTVRLDGKTVLEYSDPHPIGRGHIGLQLNSGPVSFKNIKLRPLGLENLLNGQDLTGWRPYPERQSEFSVTSEGYLQVKNGPGQLETEAKFGDFVLQAEIFTNGEHLNSGIFFRSIPGEFWNGYESQIQNGYRDGDRTQPMDCGTGGFYRRQNARRVVADDFTWFHKTLVVTGKHMAAWVNGYQVSDWTDPREPDENPRRGSRTAAGTLIIQGHDPTTDLRFRNMRAAEMAPR